MEEDKIKKKLRIKNISTISFASISGTVISGLFWLYLADLLGAENYGEIGYLLAIGAISSVVAMWGSEKQLLFILQKEYRFNPQYILFQFLLVLRQLLFFILCFKVLG